MKTRQDFVTNSSSTAFIIATKVPLTPSLLIEKFGVSTDSPFFDMVNDVCVELCDSKVRIGEFSKFFSMIEELPFKSIELQKIWDEFSYVYNVWQDYSPLRDTELIIRDDFIFCKRMRAEE